MMIRHVILASALTAMGVSLAQACSWIEPLPVFNTILDRKAKNPLTVHGVLIKIEIGSACGEAGRLLFFEVEKAFGGSALKGDTLVIATSTSTCGVDYPVGAEVVVFADKHPSCPGPAGLMWTSLPSKNIPDPSRSQLDSLYGIPPVAAVRGISEPHPRAATFPKHGWNVGGGETFPLRNGRAGSRCRADGKAMAEAGQGR